MPTRILPLLLAFLVGITGLTQAWAQAPPPALTPNGPGDDHWQDGFTLPGTNGFVTATAALPNGEVYVAGRFTAAGGVPANRIARWDGTTWHAVGTGLEFQSKYSITAITIAPNGELYAAALSNGNPTLCSVQRWDGTTWTVVGGFGAANGTIRDLAVAPTGDVYAVGYFSQYAGQPMLGIAHWDGTTWQGMGAGLNAVNSVVLTAAGDVIVGGNFHTFGAVPLDGVARWDGTAWAPLGTPPIVPEEINDLSLLPNGDVLASGTYYSRFGQPFSNLCRWNGTAWQLFGDGPGGGFYDAVQSVAVAPTGEVYVFTFEYHSTPAQDTLAIRHWTGTEWRVLKNDLTTTLCLAVTPTGSLYAGGGFTEFEGQPATNIVQLDGVAWHALGTGLNAPIRKVSASPAGVVYATGEFTQAGTLPANGLARWDGTAWAPLGAGVDGQAWTVLADPTSSTNAAYVGGTFEQAGGQPAHNIAHWDGAAWHPLGAGLGQGRPQRTQAMAITPAGALYASFVTASGFGIARWENARWTFLDTTSQGSAQALVVMPNGDLIVGGNFNTIGGISAANIARWDGTAWYPLGTGFSGGATGMVWALALAPNGELYAGGFFTQAGGQPAAHVARWDGTSWHALGNGVSGSVFALAVAPTGELYAGGSFTAVGNSTAPRLLARWEGGVWTPLGTGLNGYAAGYPAGVQVSGLSLLPTGDVVVGGSFSTVGDGSKVSAYYGRYNLVPTGLTTAEAPAPTLQIFPNPSRHRVSVRSRQAGRAQVCDLMGRVVRETTLTPQGEGTFEISELPSGLYLVRVGQQARRLVIE